MGGWSLRQFRTDLLHGAMSAGYLLFILVYLRVDTPRGRVWMLAAAAAASFLVWLAAGRRYRLVADTPTARIASAPQGYVELVGRSDLHPGTAGLGLASMPPSVWYRYVVEERMSDGKWRRVDSGRSEETFLLLDESGSCVVDPDDAEVLSSHKRVYTMGEHRHRVEYLLPGEPLYALGELVTVGGAATPLNKSSDVRELLARWKRDPKRALARFDFDGDGQIDLTEWEQARLSAEREVERQHAALRRRPGVNILRVPADGRPFLLSNRDPERLMQRFRWWSWFHLAVAVSASAMAMAWATRLAA